LSDPGHEVMEAGSRRPPLEAGQSKRPRAESQRTPRSATSRLIRHCGFSPPREVASSQYPVTSVR
jgi:hypothetical protein